MGKGENAGYQHFLLFPECFQKLFFKGRQMSGLFGKEFTSASINAVMDQSEILAFW